LKSVIAGWRSRFFHVLHAWETFLRGAILHRIVRAFFNSAAGFAHALRNEQALRQEAAVLLAALPACFFVTDNWWKRLALIGVLLIVIVVELLNTAVEALCDHVTPERHPTIGVIKDIGSAAVFTAITLAGLVWLVALLEGLV
jgi:diacylglycerol kinase (ATP)